MLCKRSEPGAGEAPQRVCLQQVWKDEFARQELKVVILHQGTALDPGSHMGAGTEDENQGFWELTNHFVGD